MRRGTDDGVRLLMFGLVGLALALVVVAGMLHRPFPAPPQVPAQTRPAR